MKPFKSTTLNIVNVGTQSRLVLKSEAFTPIQALNSATDLAMKLLDLNVSFAQQTNGRNQQFIGRIVSTACELALDQLTKFRWKDVRHMRLLAVTSVVESLKLILIVRRFPVKFQPSAVAMGTI